MGRVRFSKAENRHEGDPRDTADLGTTKKNRRRVRSAKNTEHNFGGFSDVSRDQII